ncbi:hypothetical protein J6590_048704 [Homalodisca vitripennis]|nr:hypothetical protein J6590_048704 [Homalodisca vitripennis]
MRGSVEGRQRYDLCSYGYRLGRGFISLLGIQICLIFALRHLSRVAEYIEYTLKAFHVSEKSGSVDRRRKQDCGYGCKCCNVSKLTEMVYISEMCGSVDGRRRRDQCGHAAISASSGNFAASLRLPPRDTGWTLTVALRECRWVTPRKTWRLA